MGFFELSFGAQDFLDCGFGSRDELEDPLSDFLQEAGLGEITGGGGGRDRVNIDIEIEAHVPDEEAVEALRRILKQLNAPRTAVLARSVKEKWPVYEE